ncbi:hypothetical protein TM48_04905 [Mycobacterium shottsii]|nr:hypothetical protein TM48_04905 [Mycobacterium shottsii]RFZ21667.1 hypothetical protein VIMS_00445 [Mycobacterium marinum]RFZ43777.1 hypothetical protein KST_00980 [Mycobacterium marinum]RFZ53331.1 hypothetical protein MSS4_00766 [Mycobacterium marinum]
MGNGPLQHDHLTCPAGAADTGIVASAPDRDGPGARPTRMVSSIALSGVPPPIRDVMVFIECAPRPRTPTE